VPTTYSPPTQMTKKIWMFWAQGWDAAPDLVVRCRKSWEKLNPDYEIFALDDTTISNYVGLTSEVLNDSFPVQMKSDLVRAALILKHGGVWVDATAMCCRPLTEWLPDFYETEFFAFRNPGKDRLLSNWLLASEPGNPLMKTFYEVYSGFLNDNAFSNQDNYRGLVYRSICRKLWNRRVETTVNWLSDFAKNRLKIYPYFIFHYTFNKVILENGESASIFYDAKPFEAEACHKLQKLSRRRGGLVEALEFLANDPPPVHKLNRRRDIQSPYWLGVLDVISPSDN